MNEIEELRVLANLVRAYISATECTCGPVVNNSGLKSYECWHCILEFSVRHLDAVPKSSTYRTMTDFYKATQ